MRFVDTAVVDLQILDRASDDFPGLIEIAEIEDHRLARICDFQTDLLPAFDTRCAGNELEAQAVAQILYLCRAPQREFTRHAFCQKGVSICFILRHYKLIHHKKHKKTKNAKGYSSIGLCVFCTCVFFVVNQFLLLNNFSTLTETSRRA